jgi:hypothetical protein
MEHVGFSYSAQKLSQPFHVNLLIQTASYISHKHAKLARRPPLQVNNTTVYVCDNNSFILKASAIKCFVII